MGDINNILKILSANPTISFPVEKWEGGGVYFIGIGGIGMSALARYFNSKGIKVSGYDKTPSSLTMQLEAEGIHVHFTDDVDLVDKTARLVVYTPAMPGNHKELNFYLQNNYTLVKRSELLGAITYNSFNICVAGTHGKTTTSSMLAHILRDSEYGCNAFLGGIAVNYNTNFWSSEHDVSVVEADEYDRSFLKLHPDVAIITAMDADHLDIYGTAEKMEEAFIAFTARLRQGGLLITKLGLKRSKDLKATHHLTYHLEDKQADVYAEHIRMDKGSYIFDVIIRDWKLKDVVLNMGGLHNIENAIATITVAHHLEIEDEKILHAVAGFKGVRRRFEYIIKEDELVFIDDYAHHPEELRALINGAKALFSDRKCSVIFQPHLYSRTRDLADEFASVLDLADEVILLPIYPARELPIEGVSSEMILDKMKNKNKQVVSKEVLIKTLEEKSPELLITAGAGDIDTLTGPIKLLFEKVRQGSEKSVW
jgi:UDP-N-acetylmuramate--alanine ligase